MQSRAPDLFQSEFLESDKGEYFGICRKCVLAIDKNCNVCYNEEDLA